MKIKNMDPMELEKIKHMRKIRRLHVGQIKSKNVYFLHKTTIIRQKATFFFRNSIDRALFLLKTLFTGTLIAYRTTQK